MAPTSPDSSAPSSNRVDAITRRRIELKALKKHTGWSNNECFRKMGIARRTGYRLLNEESDYNKKKGPAGRPPKITPQQIEEITGWLDKNYATRTAPWKDVKKEFGLECSWETVRRTLKKHGWPKCESCNKGHATPPARKLHTKNATPGTPTPITDHSLTCSHNQNHTPMAVEQPVQPVEDPPLHTYQTEYNQQSPFPDVQSDPYQYPDHNPYATNPYPTITARSMNYPITGD